MPASTHVSTAVSTSVSTSGSVSVSTGSMSVSTSGSVSASVSGPKSRSVSVPGSVSRRFNNPHLSKRKLSIYPPVDHSTSVPGSISAARTLSSSSSTFSTSLSSSHQSTQHHQSIQHHKSTRTQQHGYNTQPDEQQASQPSFIAPSTSDMRHMSRGGNQEDVHDSSRGDIRRLEYNHASNSSKSRRQNMYDSNSDKRRVSSSSSSQDHIHDSTGDRRRTQEYKHTSRSSKGDPRRGQDDLRDSSSRMRHPEHSLPGLPRESNDPVHRRVDSSQLSPVSDSPRSDLSRERGLNPKRLSTSSASRGPKPHRGKKGGNHPRSVHRNVAHRNSNSSGDRQVGVKKKKRKKRPLRKFFSSPAGFCVHGRHISKAPPKT